MIPGTILKQHELQRLGLRRAPALCCEEASSPSGCAGKPGTFRLGFLDTHFAPSCIGSRPESTVLRNKSGANFRATILPGRSLATP